MKKSIGITVFAVLIAANMALAREGTMDEKQNDPMMKKDMKHGMMGKGMMGAKGMMGMQGMMMKMMERSVVVTSDGGIVVVSASKLSKYDKDLNLIKEVDLKSDMDSMQKMMSEMMAKCPMMKEMTEGMDKQSDQSQDSTAAEDEVDHASHHK